MEQPGVVVMRLEKVIEASDKYQEEKDKADKELKRGTQRH